MRVRLILVALVFVMTSCAQSSIERRIGRVEQGLSNALGDPPWKRMGLAERMQYFHVPGVSIAVINDYQIEWVKGYGVLEAGTSERVTPDTLFQTASLGKPVVAVAALQHIDQGKLELDGEVNRSLVSWKVPASEFTAQEEVTLRRLLSHSAGTTVGGFDGYAQGEDVPNLQQILDGQPPANSPPVRVNTIPGTKQIYSGGGFMIVQQILEDVASKPFPDLMQDTVFEPWDMTASTFKSPLPEHLETIAASGHRADGTAIPGGWHTYPEMGSGASMWSTSSDMANFLIGVMLSYTGWSDEVLSHEMAIEMLTPQIDDRGLGPVVMDDGGDLFYFLHPGGNEGYRNYMIAYPKKGQGIVIMTNGDNGEALYDEIKNSVTVEYGWVRDYTYLYVGIVVVIVLALLGVLLLRRLRARNIPSDG